MTATLTADKVKTFKDAGETFHLTPMDHGGYVITYVSGDVELFLTSTDKVWVGAGEIAWGSDAGEDAVRWHDLKAAKARIRELNRA